MAVGQRPRWPLTALAAGGRSAGALGAESDGLAACRRQYGGSVEVSC